MKTDPPSKSERRSGKSARLATATAVKTSGAPLPKASSVMPATSGGRTRSSERRVSCGMKKRSAVDPRQQIVSSSSSAQSGANAAGEAPS